MGSSRDEMDPHECPKETRSLFIFITRVTRELIHNLIFTSSLLSSLDSYGSFFLPSFDDPIRLFPYFHSPRGKMRTGHSLLRLESGQKGNGKKGLTGSNEAIRLLFSLSLFLRPHLRSDVSQIEFPRNRQRVKVKGRKRRMRG